MKYITTKAIGEAMKQNVLLYGDKRTECMLLGIEMADLLDEIKIAHILYSADLFETEYLRAVNEGMSLTQFVIPRRKTTYSEIRVSNENETGVIQ